jgi:hypothetical protein
MRPEREADHLSLSSEEVTNVRCFTSTVLNDVSELLVIIPSVPFKTQT